jgi:acyl dehydratase
MPLNKDCIGRVYTADARVIQIDQGIAYAQATMDTCPSLLSGEAMPPMFAVNPIIDVAMMVCRDKELGVDMLRLVHGEEDMRFHRLLLPGESVRPESTVLGVQSKASGELLLLEHRLWVNEECVVESKATYFIRAPKPAGDSDAPKAKPKSPAPRRPETTGAPLFKASLTVPATQPTEYAQASRDLNPIHTDEQLAQKAGLPGCILHGLCTMAMAAHHVVSHVAEGDPARLARIGVRFSNLVLPGDTLTYEGFDAGSAEGLQSIGLAVSNQGGQAVLTKARAWVRA